MKRLGADAVLFDRDGTLVIDVPDNGDPSAVVPVPGGFTRPDEIDAAPRVARDLAEAVERWALTGAPPGSPA